MVHSYNDFVETLLTAGFSMGGGSADGIYAVIPWGWKETPPYETPIRWHSDDPEIDPWEWRMRVLDERSDIAYSKLFFKKSGFITKEWYPYFLAVRRGGMSFDEAYQDGTISHYAKRIYDLVTEQSSIDLYSIKQKAGFTKNEKSSFDRAITELQMKMYLTICGRHLELTKTGEPYGWPITVVCTTERFFGHEVFETAEMIPEGDAISIIRERILKLNPSAEDKRINKFVHG
jgi:hypothetical protein